VGSSIAIFDETSGQRVSGDMFAVGATMPHRGVVVAIATVKPGAGAHTYALRFKTDPNGAAWVSATYLLAVKLNQAFYSGPHGDQSTTSVNFVPTAESRTFNVASGEHVLLIGSAQVWNDNPAVTSNICVSRDGVRISGDMLSLGATWTHRSIGAAVAVDTPTPGTHTYTLDFKTAANGKAWVSGSYLIAVIVASASSASLGADQSTQSKIFTTTAQALQLTSSGGKYLLIATGQLWGDSPATGQSLAITRDDTRISGDMFTVGTSPNHLHTTTVIAIDSPGTGVHTYAVAYKTD